MTIKGNNTIVIVFSTGNAQADKAAEEVATNQHTVIDIPFSFLSQI